MENERTLYQAGNTSVQPISQTLQIPQLQPLSVPAAVVGQTGGKILQINTVLLNLEVAKEPYVVTYPALTNINGYVLMQIGSGYYTRIKKIRLDGDKADINSLSIQVKTQDINNNISIDRSFPIVNYTRYIDQLGNAQELFLDILLSQPGGAVFTNVFWQKATPLSNDLTITVSFDIIPFK